MGFLDLPGLGKAHYHEYGTGTKPMLAFHGYGMTGKQFNVLEKSVLKQYHVYGFDHFFHGQSTLTNWTEKQILAGMPRTFVKAYAEEWFKLHGKQRISIMAYSIGAGFALILAEEFAPLIDEIILMAPDAIAGYNGFRFLQHNFWGKLLFKTFTKSKWLAPSILKGLKKFGLIDDSLHTIAYNEVDTPQKRMDVYYTLNLIRNLKPDVEKIAGLINRYNIKCTLVFGRDDLLFPMAPVQPFLDLLENAQVYQVPFGHWLVTQELDNYLVNLKP